MQFEWQKKARSNEILNTFQNRISWLSFDGFMHKHTDNATHVHNVFFSSLFCLFFVASFTSNTIKCEKFHHMMNRSSITSRGTYSLQRSTNLWFPWWSSWSAAMFCPILSRVYWGFHGTLDCREDSQQTRAPPNSILHW